MRARHGLRYTELRPRVFSGTNGPINGMQDIKAAKATLQSKDVRIDGGIVTIEGMVSLLTFYDQDDNSLMFYQELAPDA